MSTEKILDMSKVLKQKNEYSKIRETIESERSKILDNMMYTGNIDAVLDQFTTEEIENMSFSKMKETFVNENGQFVFNEEEFSKQMIMDFIIYLKHSRVAFDKMDEEMDKMDKTLEDFDKEVKALTGETSFNKTLRASIEADLEREDLNEATKEKCNTLLSALDDAVTLRPLFELYDRVSPENTLKELKDNARRSATLKGYVNVCKENGIEPKLLKFGEFEKLCLDEKYHEHKDLFIFILARYIKYLGKNVNSLQNRTFVVQLTNYIREIIMGEDNVHYKADVEEIVKLKESIASLLDRFYK